MTPLQAFVFALNIMNVEFLKQEVEGETFISVECGTHVTTYYTFCQEGNLRQQLTEFHGISSERYEVFAALDSERQHQKRRWGRRQPDGSFEETLQPIGNWLTFMRYYLNEADKALSTNSGDEAALEMIRKVTALGVACHQQHGCRERDPMVLVTNGHDGMRA